MGQLLRGQWTNQDIRAPNAHGEFVRPESPWRRHIQADPQAQFGAEPGRYHLYINVGCPWAYRTYLYRTLKNLESVISVSTTQAGVGPEGWTFLDSNGNSSDEHTSFSHVHQVYNAAEPDFTGRATVPVLWDKKLKTIVNNESAEIIRMLNSEFNAFTDNQIDYYPVNRRKKIDEINEDVYDNLNNGVYRAGFAASQDAYEAACNDVFACLDRLEARLNRQCYLVGDGITEADWRLFSTLLRFDLAYYPVFRCNQRRLVDYPNLWSYARDLFQQPKVAATVDWQAFKTIYWSRTGIIPLGPNDDWHAPHQR